MVQPEVRSATGVDSSVAKEAEVDPNQTNDQPSYRDANHDPILPLPNRVRSSAVCDIHDTSFRRNARHFSLEPSKSTSKSPSSGFPGRTTRTAWNCPSGVRFSTLWTTLKEIGVKRL